MNTSRYITIGVLACIIVAILVAVFVFSSTTEAPTEDQNPVATETQEPTTPSLAPGNTGTPTQTQNPSPTTPSVPPTETLQPPNEQPATPPSEEVKQDIQEPATYTEYSQGAFTKAQNDGKTIVLFFHAPWCPTCAFLDNDIAEGLQRIPTNTAIFKIDYDSTNDLKKDYNIQSQHSLVFIPKNQEPPYPVKVGISLSNIITTLGAL